MSTSAFLSDSARWNAVRQKDALADGIFVYAVRTTMIYCRPVCKARLARRANVVFYDTADEAERANYRPCKRCKPDLAGRMPEGKAAQRVRAMVGQEFPLAGAGAGAGTGGKLAEMAKQAGLSKWHFHRVFKEVTSMTPIEYMRHQSGDSPSYPVSGLDMECSDSQSYGVMEEMTTTPELAGSAITSTKAGLAVSPASPLPNLGSEHLAIDPALYDLDFNLDDFLTNLNDDFFEKLPHMSDEHESTISDPWTLAHL
jgi:methylphosphotriester-DNA--protein-cysteine methyltransferase